MAREQKHTSKSIGDGSGDQGDLVQSVGDSQRRLAGRDSKRGIGTDSTVLREEAGRIIPAVTISSDADPWETE